MSRRDRWDRPPGLSGQARRLVPRMSRSHVCRNDICRNGLAVAAMLVIPAGLCLAQTSRRMPQQTPPASGPADAPARTMGYGAARVRAVSDDAGSGNGTGSGLPAGFDTTAILERYRQMWQRMTPAQQTMFVQNGGRTPDEYERMLKGSGAGFTPGRSEGPRTTAPARVSDPARGSDLRDAGKGIDSGALDSLSKSLQDLNAIRDGNLGRVQKDGCPPEIARRIADLTGKLLSDQFELNGGRPPAAIPAAGSTEKSSQTDPLAVAGDWFKRPSGEKSPGSDSGIGNGGREGKLLDAVLTGATPAAATPKLWIDPNSPEAAQKRKALEEEIARLKTELGQLSGGCAAPRP